MDSGNTYNFKADPRFPVLARALHRLDPEKPGQGRLAARGLLVDVVRWTAWHAPNGDLSTYAPSVLAEAVGWEHPPEQLMAILKEAGFIDLDGHFVGLKSMYSANEGFIDYVFGDE